MPISTPDSSTSLWPVNRSSPGNVKDIARRLTHAKGENAVLFSAAGEGLGSLQRQLDAVIDDCLAVATEEPERNRQFSGPSTQPCMTAHDIIPRISARGVVYSSAF
jgi:hypothetical protein